ncbi:MAG: nucleotidyltransferase domain-containing protein [Candidatus Nanohaloarchaea archaeon]|nr:nucleotidyltransferase domain-containing protein [Candidatus Nanohaloarchaea archaeon]
MFPTQILRSEAQRKILRVLAEKNKRYTVKELAEMCQRSEASISKALKNSNRYPFISREKIPGSRKLTIRLNPDSEYSEAIKKFFKIERRKERGNGTVPVHIWNLLEDITTKLANNIKGIIELFLFGSYAEGDYHAGSDIDLFLVHNGTGQKVKEKANNLLSDFEKDTQLITAVIEEPDKDHIRDLIHDRSPVRDVDTLIPLIGEVKEI